jgi:ferrochelatase
MLLRNSAPDDLDLLLKMTEKSKGVILLNLGGPDSLEAVRPFLFNLFSDREIIKLGPSFLQKPLAYLIAATRARKTRSNYQLIGGGSPLLKITLDQAKALEKNLGRGFKTYVGMRYWQPNIHDAVDKALGDGVEEFIALPLFPQYSISTTGSCFKELKRVISERGESLNVDFIKSWHTNPVYLEALASTIREGLNVLSREEGDVHVLFSAHSIPQQLIEIGDPYVDQTRETVKRVVDLLAIDSWGLSFQSRSGPVKWVGPDTKETLTRFAEKGLKKVLIVPISFVSDHIETLYEMDILYKKIGEKQGIIVNRVQSLNTLLRFIEALEDIVKKTVAKGLRRKT